MKTETITRIKLTAGEGMMLTDGASFGTTVRLGKEADGSVWQEITDADAQALADKQSDL